MGSIWKVFLEQVRLKLNRRNKMIYVFAALGIFFCLGSVFAGWKWFTSEQKSKIYAYQKAGKWAIRKRHTDQYWDASDNTFGREQWANWYDSEDKAFECFQTRAGSSDYEIRSYLAPKNAKSPACKLKLKFYNWLQKEC